MVVLNENNRAQSNNKTKTTLVYHYHAKAQSWTTYRVRAKWLGTLDPGLMLVVRMDGVGLPSLQRPSMVKKGGLDRFVNGSGFCEDSPPILVVSIDIVGDFV